MNINPDKVKKLILLFAELDEEYQDKLLHEAAKLRMLQNEKNHLKKSKATFKSKEEFQQEVERKANESAKDALEMLDILKKVSDTDKAAMLMMMNQLAHKTNTVQESDISITVNQWEIPMKEYLDKHLLNVDYDKAKVMTEDFVNEMKRQGLIQ